MIKASVLVPTYNRPKDLLSFVQSLLAQSVLPFELLVVDDGDLDERVIDEIKRSVELRDIFFVYFKKDHGKVRRGLSESKNLGVEMVRGNICFIFDDDVTLDKFFLERSMRVWHEEHNPHLIAVGGIIVNNRRQGRVEKLYNKLFGLSSKSSWDINDLGYQIWDDGIEDRVKGGYTHGGVCSVNVELARQIKFPVFDGGRSTLEDVAFYAQAKKAGMYAIVDPTIKLVHTHSAVARESQFMVGYKESSNRVDIFYTLHERPELWVWVRFFWSGIGWVLRQVLVGHFARAWGMLNGYKRLFDLKYDLA